MGPLVYSHKIKDEKVRGINETIIRVQGALNAQQHDKLALQKKADEAQRKADKAQQKAEKEQDKAAIEQLKADEAKRKADEAAARIKPPPSPSGRKSKSFTKPDKTDDTPRKKLF
jgi:hypothetical protein